MTELSSGGRQVSIPRIPAHEAVVHGSSHVRALDGIRGVAILLVLIYHLGNSVGGEFGLPRIFRLAAFGWVGVDLFFVLSGFLITGILYDSKSHSHFFKNFYMRRALRIFPLYFSALIFLLLLRTAWPSLGLYGQASDGWLWVYLANVVIAVQGFGAFGLMDHFWSLAIEEQFYLMWPFVVYALDRRGAMRVALAMCLAAPLLRTMLAVTTDNSPAIYVLSPMRMDSLAMGALLSLAIRGPDAVDPGRLVRPALWTVVSATVVVAAIVLATRDLSAHSWAMETFGLSAVSMIGVSLIVLSLASPVKRFFEHGVLRWFGKYSYGLYVWHPILWMIIFHSNWARSLRGSNETEAMLISLAAAIGLLLVFVMGSWHLMESQFLKLKVRFQ
ncbi:acyltransferase [Variovorax dokdonensis]|uniref:Acyltransferase n=1 Tax=Variovorax dokdonensis TaxID=344883 RepID=A0ABT7NB43_9BURK|nr:acyltransferase [Variovorax dokdonensis]MDM0045115.1 acyltransferase [Variovorax dokdonensis]